MSTIKFRREVTKSVNCPEGNNSISSTSFLGTSKTIQASSMGLSCRICKHKFSVPLTLEEEPSQDFNITTTKCGHLFHQKCLDASLTHQKLSHAMHGTGPFRTVCPAFQCGTVLGFDSDIIKLCVTPEELKNDWEEEEDESVDIRMTKQLQRISVERDQWKTKADSLQSENEILNDAMEEIKAECDEMRSFLHEDEMIQKGDRVFRVNTDGSLSPAKIIELRQKSSRAMPYAVIKLERKKKSGSSAGTLQTERESFVVPANELLTFKSFFKEYFDDFSSKLKMIMSEMVVVQPGLLTPGKSFRNLYKKRSSAGELSTSFTSNFSISHETIDKLIVEPLDDSPKSSTTESYVKSTNAKRTNYGISRRKTFHSGIGSAKTTSKSPAKVRSISQSSCPQTISISESASTISFDYSSGMNSVFQSPVRETAQEEHHEYISEGERVIWYDAYCEHPQVGNVAALLQYTKCAIVKFDKLPSGPKQFEYRTVPIQQLFPYDLASPEEKFRIAVIYEFSLDDDTIDEDEEAGVDNLDNGNEYEYKLDYNENHEIHPDYDVANSVTSSSSIEEPEVEERTPYDAITATIFSMFYSTNIFERNLLDVDSSDDEKQRNIKQILTDDIIPSAKSTGDLSENLVQDVLNILGYGSEDYVQPQEFLVNMFEEVLKSKPFMTFASGKEQSVLHLAIPEFHEESMMFAGENNQQQISYLDELFFMTLQTAGDQLTSIPSPALILNVNRPHFSHGSFIVPPVKLCLDQALSIGNIDEEDLCSCNKIATWKCHTCVETLKDTVPGYCDDCRHIAADFHKDSDHFPLLRCSKEGSYKKLKLHAVICKSKNNSYSAFIKCGMGHSDSWVLFQPSRKNISKIITVRSIESWLEHLEPNPDAVINPEEIPGHVLKLLKEGSVFIYVVL